MTAQPDWESQANRALMTGMVMGTLMRASTDQDHPLYGCGIEPEIDGAGNYTRHIEITSPSGSRYRISVFEEWTIGEELDRAA